MTRDELKARFPGASEAFLTRNAAGQIRLVVPPPAPPPSPGGDRAPATESKPGRAGSTARRKVPRVRNAGTWTEAEYWSRLRSCLRGMFRWWLPARAVLRRARRAANGVRGARVKWVYECAACHGCTFIRREVEVDHVIPCGSLRSLADLAAFVERMTPEAESGFQVLCKSCHQTKTNKERAP